MTLPTVIPSQNLVTGQRKLRTASRQNLPSGYQSGLKLGPIPDFNHERDDPTAQCDFNAYINEQEKSTDPCNPSLQRCPCCSTDSVVGQREPEALARLVPECGG